MLGHGTLGLLENVWIEEYICCRSCPTSVMSVIEWVIGLFCFFQTSTLGGLWDEKHLHVLQRLSSLIYKS